MKKTIFMSLLGIFICMTMNAETIDEVQNVSSPCGSSSFASQEVQNAQEVKANEVHFPVLNPAMESSALMTPYQSALPAVDEGYRQSQEWRDALHLRNAGAIVCSLGLACFVAGGVVMFSGILDTETTGDAESGLRTWEKGVIVSCVSLIPVAGGAVMWGIGNHKKKKIQMQYTGNGLTMNF